MLWLRCTKAFKSFLTLKRTNNPQWKDCPHRERQKTEVKMPSTGNLRKNEQLGMPNGTANNRLRKLILFDLLKRHNENVCFQCGEVIETANELSIEHKQAWLDRSPDLFWDLDNIAFSHLHCNISAGRRREMSEKRLFSDEKLDEIQTRLSQGTTCAEIARDEGCNRETISQIKCGVNYKRKVEA